LEDKEFDDAIAKAMIFKKKMKRKKEKKTKGKKVHFQLNNPIIVWPHQTL
jgi:hypothetical protein